MATHSSTLAWEIPQTEEVGGGPHIVHGVTKSQARLSKQLNLSIFIYTILDSLLTPSLLSPL